MSLDAIPDRPERKKYERKVQVGVSTKSGTAIELLRLALKLLEES
jgi:hypothetical protein